MPRYVKQKNSYSCAPVAIINVGKWAGNLLSFKRDFKYIFKEIKCSRNFGTSVDEIDRFLRQNFKNILKIEKKIYPNVSYDDLKNHINKGGTILFSYSYFDNNKNIQCHIAFYTSLKENLWIGYNVHRNETMSMVSEITMNELLTFKDEPAVVWFLTKLSTSNRFRKNGSS